MPLLLTTVVLALLAVAVVVTDCDGEVDAVVALDEEGDELFCNELDVFASERLLLFEAASCDIRRTPDCLLDCLF